MNGTAPVMPVDCPPACRRRRSAASTPDGNSVSVTLIGPGPFEAPERERDRCTDAPRRATPRRTTVIDSVADPIPDAGDTCSHGWFGVAVHVTVPLPLWISRITCAAVWRRTRHRLSPRRSAARFDPKPTSGSVLTVSSAALLVTAPALLVTRTRYRFPPRVEAPTVIENRRGRTYGAAAGDVHPRHRVRRNLPLVGWSGFAVAVTVNCANWLPAATTTFAGCTWIWGAAAADCVSVKVWPAIVTVALRADSDGLAPYTYVATPLPDPAPAVTTTQDALLTAVQLQPAGPVTVIVPKLLVGPTDDCVADNANVQMTVPPKTRTSAKSSCVPASADTAPAAMIRLLAC